MIFYKMTGSGNDFVVLDGRETDISAWPAERIRAVCHRRSGIGADGLVILSPGASGAVVMTFFNSDGSRAAMCGNAALCSTRLAARLGLAGAGVGAGSDITLQTDAGSFLTRCVGSGWEAELNLPSFDAPVPVPEVELGQGELFLTRAMVGVPHLTVFVRDIETPDLMDRGKVLRRHPGAGPDGANVNFVARPGAEDAPWPIRTYERGVEAETLACGTGTVAVAASLVDNGVTTVPRGFLTRGGQVLSVSGRREGGIWADVWLRGEGRVVFLAQMNDE